MPRSKAKAKGRTNKKQPAKKPNSDVIMVDGPVPDTDSIPVAEIVLPTKRAIPENEDTETVQKKPKPNQDSDSEDGEVAPDVFVVVDWKLLEPDLKKSYVDEFAKWKKDETKKNPPPLKPKRAKWQFDVKKPFNDAAKLPEGWEWHEPDLDKLDIDAQIQRCKERIAEQIMPFYFEQRLKGYKEAKAIRTAMESSEKGTYSLDVLQRIDTLKIIEKSFETGEDRYKQLPNIKALLKAYRSGKLDWYDGLVTYWSHGHQLCEPRPHNWYEFEAINVKHKGWESFWMEGYDGPGPKPQMAAKQRINPDGQGLHEYTAGVRLTNLTGSSVLQPLTFMKQVGAVTNENTPTEGEPWDAVLPTASHPWWADLEFVHDTGASVLFLYYDDLDTLMGNFRPPQVNYPRLTGASVILDFTATTHVRNSIMVEVCLLVGANSNTRMTQWTRTVASLQPGTYTPGVNFRSDDHWMRGMVYQATQPDRDQALRLAVTKGGLDLEAKPQHAPDPRWFYPGPDPPWPVPWLQLLTQLPLGTVAAAKVPPRPARVR